jgi:hypothetical protein
MALASAPIKSFINKNALDSVMHKLKKKKGKKTVTHHFSHVKDKHGKKKHVYLGTHKKKSKERLTKLKVARLRSNNKTIRKLENAQKKLDRISFYNKSYDEIVNDIIKSHYKEKHIERLMNDRTRKSFPGFTLLMSLLGIVVIGGASYFLIKNPQLTGAAVQGVTGSAAGKIIPFAIGLLVVLVICGVLLHRMKSRTSGTQRIEETDEPAPPKPE